MAVISCLPQSRTKSLSKSLNPADSLGAANSEVASLFGETGRSGDGELELIEGVARVRVIRGIVGGVWISVTVLLLRKGEPTFRLPFVGYHKTRQTFYCQVAPSLPKRRAAHWSPEAQNYALGYTRYWMYVFWAGDQDC